MQTSPAHGSSLRKTGACLLWMQEMLGRSLIIDPADLWDPERGIYANPQGEGRTWERAAEMTYVDKDRSSGFHAPLGVRIHGGGSRSFEKKSLRLYFRQAYGLDRLDYPLFSGEVQSFKHLVLHNGGQDCPNMHRGPLGNWTLMRNWLVDRLALQMGGHAVQDQPVLVFVNAEPWGIYQLRERIDRHFLADHYALEEIDLIKAPGLDPGQTVEEGDSQHWDHLLRFVQEHDLREAEHYAYVQSQIDLSNFIDYNLFQIYLAHEDWPRHNMIQFRPRVQGGRWQWIFWDSDGGWGAGPAFPSSRYHPLDQEVLWTI